MNTYKIIFTRENGTQGTDHFTAINERQARKDFGECYRHSTATIISIELASTNTPATKQQERDTLEKIRKMVEQLGPDSYLATAFEGCFDLAAGMARDVMRKRPPLERPSVVLRPPRPKSSN